MISVVAGHTTTCFENVFYYHMPLFFILSGYTFKPKDTILRHITTLFKGLALPLILYCFVLHILSPWHPSWHQYLWGGEELCGIYGVIWFMPVFIGAKFFLWFFPQNRSMLVKAVTIIILMLLSYGLSTIDIFRFQDIRIVPMALAYMLVGISFREKKEIENNVNNYCWALISISVFALLFCISGLKINMKIANFGVPVISFIISVIMVVCLAIFSMCLEKHEHNNIIIKYLTFVGGNSLFFMYTHQYVHYVLLPYLPKIDFGGISFGQYPYIGILSFAVVLFITTVLCLLKISVETIIIHKKY